MGTVFKLDPSTGVESVVHSFPADRTDGTYPAAELHAVGDQLYGTTVFGSYGVSGGGGTVFRLRP